jgi:hypothetical protein
MPCGTNPVDLLQVQRSGVYLLHTKHLSCAPNIPPPYNCTRTKATLITAALALIQPNKGCPLLKKYAAAVVLMIAQSTLT